MSADPVVITTTCPVCGEQMTSLTESDKPTNVGVNKVQTHIRSTTEEGHGPTGVIPAELSVDKLRSCVKVSEAAVAP